MVAFFARKGLISPPVLALCAAVVAAILAIFVPVYRLEQWSVDSGIAAIVDAAQPPLGLRAQAAFAFVCAVVAGGGVLILAFLVKALAPRRRRRRSRPPEAVIVMGDESVPQVRRADAHPDAPPRAPLLATRDLGMPFLEIHAPVDEVDAPETAIESAVLPVAPEPPAAIEPIAMPEEQELPIDLDTPLSTVDPVSFEAALRLEVSKPATVPEPAPEPDPVVRIETFELTPPVRRPHPHRPLANLRPVPDSEPPAPPSESLAAPQTDATIHALLDRLERGIAAREAANAHRRRAQGLQDTLSELRQMAQR